MDYRNLAEAFTSFVGDGEPLTDLPIRRLLQSTFRAGATAALRLLEDGEYTLEALRQELAAALDQ